MEFVREILSKFEAGSLNWADARHFLEYSSPVDWEWFFSEVARIRYKKQNASKMLKVYTPGHNFPAISVTGTDCELHCEHCDKKYLQNMVQGETVENFENALYDRQKKGAIGALISGGCTSDGKVPVLKYIKSIEKFKANNPFYLNAHVGLVDYSEAIQLKYIGIDTVSYDMVLDQTVIDDVFHSDVEVEDYIVSFVNLREAGLRVVPHLLIGARFGKIAREVDVLKILAQKPPELMVFIAMIPPKPNIPASEQFNHLKAEDIGKFIFIATALMQGVELSLGCMRPRGKISFDLERWAIMAGVSRMEIPSQKTLRWLKEQEYELKFFGACCAISSKFEPYAQAENIKGDLKYPDLMPKKKRPQQ